MFKKGHSGNNKGRPRGTGKLQLMRQRVLAKEVADQRFKEVLAELDAWHTKRLEILLDYATLRGEFALKLSDINEDSRETRHKTR